MLELIDRQAALEIAMGYCPDDDGCCSKTGHDIREMLDEIDALPIVHIDDMTFKIQNKIQAKKPSGTVEITFVRYGTWVQRGNGEYYCSNCGREERFIFQKNYCPRCGTRMDATDKNDDGKGCNDSAGD